MAFVSEDGTGLANANSYGTVQGFKDYYTDRGTDVSAITDPTIETLLIKATDYVERRWSGRFKGSLEFPDTQALSFPRLYLYSREGRLLTGVPLLLEQAIYEYALRANSAALAPDPSVDASGKAIVAKQDVVGPVTESREFSQGGGVDFLFRPYPIADAMIRKLTVSGGGVIRN